MRDPATTRYVIASPLMELSRELAGWVAVVKWREMHCGAVKILMRPDNTYQALPCLSSTSQSLQTAAGHHVEYEVFSLC